MPALPSTESRDTNPLMSNLVMSYSETAINRICLTFRWVLGSQRGGSSLRYGTECAIPGWATNAENKKFLVTKLIKTYHASLRTIACAWLILSVGAIGASAAKLDPSGWTIYNFSGSLASTLANPLPPTALHVVVTNQGTNVPQPQTQGSTLSPTNVLTGLTDNNLATYATLDYPATMVIDLGTNCVVDRVYLIGNVDLSTNVWNNYAANANSTTGGTPPLGLIDVYVGSTPTTTTQVGTWTVPYDAGNPIETEADIRFSPAAGRFIRIALQTQVTWGSSYWPGFPLSSQPASTNVSLNVGEVEVYGFTGTNATATNLNAIVVPAYVLNSNAYNSVYAPLAIAAQDLSYYLGELTGLPHPIITPASTNSFSGNLYNIIDNAPLAPTCATMMANISSGILPTNVCATIQGRAIYFNSWPYRATLWSVWDFLELQGVRWTYPAAHGDYVPTGNGVNLSTVRFTNNPPTVSVYANFDCNVFEPWSVGTLQSVRQSYLYPWRNHWTYFWDGYGPLGGSEIPSQAQSGTINPLFSEGFTGYPGNFNNLMPDRILETKAYTNWWGWATTSSSSAIESSGGQPTFAMNTPAAISWVAQKVTNWNAVDPLQCSSPLNICHINRPWQLLPVDACTYSEDPYSMAANAPDASIPNPTAWVCLYTNSWSGAYFNFVAGVANAVQQMGSSALVGALAYADVFLPPADFGPFPTNVQVEVCLYGAPNLPMGSPLNSGLSNALYSWHTNCSHLATYDYALLHTDYLEPDPRLPVPLIAGTVDKAQFLASIGALDGGCQANLTSLPYNPWNFYAYPRIRWNTNQTASSLEAEFFNGYFREAAAPMLAYYQAMENYQVANNVNMHFGGYCYGIMPDSFPIPVLATMQSDLIAAESAATNWYVSNRVATAAQGFGWLITNSPDNLVGVNLGNALSFTALNTQLGPVTANLKSMTAPSLGYNNNYGNYATLQSSGTWCFYAQGQIQQTFNVPAGTYTVNVTANGVPSANVWPIMNVYFGPLIGSVTVNSATSATYSFTTTLPAGAWDLAITYNNAAPAGARNLIVTKITITQQ
jgi:hypothetical protein